VTWDLRTLPDAPVDHPQRDEVPGQHPSRDVVRCVDVPNGLYILRYTGPRASELDQVSFLEGNSNLGDAIRIDKSAGED
jgi:hypothetical protein